MLIYLFFNLFIHSILVWQSQQQVIVTVLHCNVITSSVIILVYKCNNRYSVIYKTNKEVFFMQNIYCTEKILHIGNRSLIQGTCIHIYNTNNDEWILQIRWWVWQLLDFTSLKWSCPSTNKHKYLVVMVSTSITINTNKI